MRTKIHSGILCAFLMIAVFVSGIYCKGLYDDPVLLRAADTTSAALLQDIGQDLSTDIYLEKDPLAPEEHAVLMRQPLRPSFCLRAVRLLTDIFLLAGACLSLLSLRRSFLYAIVYDDHYHQRTLAYIHRNDGKKS